ncbi:MAG: RHS repeat-associated core domain-containing protein [Bacilli bacterium]
MITNEKYNYSITIKDQLISIQNATTGNIIKEFKYENSYKGNPTTIVKDGVSQNLVWEGRKLKQIGNTSFVYNEEGIRIKKAGSNFVENYTLEGNRIIKLHRDSEGGSYDMYFNYDEQGELVGLSCEGKEYFYIRDITGNITKIVDEDGRCVVKYDYDAWGNFKKTIYIDNYVSHSNPFVYKGYFFDSETGWYYLKSRYYDPSIRRFISADNYNYLDSESLNGINLYSYCGNNPILGYDPEGTWSWGKFWGVVAVVAIAAVAIAVTVASCGAAAAGAGFLASCAVSSIGAYTLAATATTVATIATYVVATTTVIGITAFAIADIQSIVTDGQNNYLSF